MFRDPCLLDAIPEQRSNQWFFLPGAKGFVCEPWPPKDKLELCEVHCGSTSEDKGERRWGSLCGIAALWILLLGCAFSELSPLFSVSGVASPSVTGPRERNERVGSDGILDRVRGRVCASGIDTGETGRRFELNR